MCDKRKSKKHETRTFQALPFGGRIAIFGVGPAVDGDEELEDEDEEEEEEEDDAAAEAAAAGEPAL